MRRATPCLPNGIKSAHVERIAEDVQSVSASLAAPIGTLVPTTYSSNVRYCNFDDQSYRVCVIALSAASEGCRTYVCGCVTFVRSCSIVVRCVGVVLCDGFRLFVLSVASCATGLNSCVYVCMCVVVVFCGSCLCVCLCLRLCLLLMVFVCVCVAAVCVVVRTGVCSRLCLRPCFLVLVLVFVVVCLCVCSYLMILFVCVVLGSMMNNFFLQISKSPMGSSSCHFSQHVLLGHQQPVAV